MLIGHFHRWFAAKENGLLEWNGTNPLPLEPDCRYLVIVDAVMNGSFAVFDDSANVLTPHRCNRHG